MYATDTCHKTFTVAACMQQTSSNTIDSLIDFRDDRVLQGEESAAVGGTIELGGGCMATDAIPTSTLFNMVNTQDAVPSQPNAKGAPPPPPQDKIIADVEPVPGQSILIASAVVSEGISSATAVDQQYVYNPNNIF